MSSRKCSFEKINRQSITLNLATDLHAMKKRLISITPPHTIAQTLNHQQQTQKIAKQQNPTSSAAAATATAATAAASTRVLFLLHENFRFLSNITKESRKRTPTHWRLSPLQRCVFQTQRDVLLFSLEMEKRGKKSWRKPEQKQTERTILSSPIALHPHCVPPPSPPPPSPPLAPPPSSTQKSPTTREEKLLHPNKNSRGCNCQEKTTKWRRRRWFRCYSYPAAAILII